MSILLILSGLPGTGKSTVARIVREKFSIPVFAKDELEAVLIRSELARYEHPRLGYSGYELLTECATRVLSAKGSVALDSVCGREKIRQGWRSLAQANGAKFVAIECICSDEALHRQRLEKRERNIPGWPELNWDEVVRVKSYYEPWRQECLVIDSCSSLQKNEASIIAYLRGEFAKVQGH